MVYVVVGLTAGQLVHTANYRKWQRDEVISKSQRTEMVQGLTGLLTALGVRDAATLAHSRRVAAIAVRIGEQMGLDSVVVNDLRLAGLVHDIGKAGVPDDILFKDGSLTEEQTVVMRSHVDLAVSMLRAIPGTDTIARIVSQHHECPDGSGYPRGLRAKAIDPAASILRVADVYAALTEPRPYHTPTDTSAALARLFQAQVPMGIVSNGSRMSIHNVVHHSGLEWAFSELVSVEDLAVFKPHAAVYALAEQRMRQPRANILFVSSNAWDVAAAGFFGFKTCWSNRQSAPFEQLGAAPTHTVGNLQQMADWVLQSDKFLRNAVRERSASAT